MQVCGLDECEEEGVKIMISTSVDAPRHARADPNRRSSTLPSYASNDHILTRAQVTTVGGIRPGSLARKTGRQRLNDAIASARENQAATSSHEEWVHLRI